MDSTNTALLLGYGTASLNAAVAASIIMWELTRQEPEEKCLI